MIKKTCDFCNKIFWVHLYRQKNARFCSYDCYHGYQKKLAYLPKICPQCNTEFSINRKTRYNKYCSEKCSLLGRRKYEHEDKICLFCKTQFKFKPKNPLQIFCSQQCNVKSRAHKVDENFFNKINSEGKAYLLGLIFADGSVSSKKSYINLTLNDEKLLKICKKLLKTDRHLYSYNNKSYSLIIGNKKLHQTLIKLGVLQRKSWKELSLPSIPKNLMCHFLRGVHDGDGSFFLDKREGGKYCYLVSSFCCGSYRFLTEIKNYTESKLNVTFQKVRFDDKGNATGSYQLRLSRKKDIKKFTDYLYKNANYYMDRKYDFVKNFYHE